MQEKIERIERGDGWIDEILAKQELAESDRAQLLNEMFRLAYSDKPRELDRLVDKMAAAGYKFVQDAEKDPHEFRVEKIGQ